MFGGMTRTLAFGRYVAPAASPYPPIGYPAIQDLFYTATNLSGNVVTESNGTGKNLTAYSTPSATVDGVTVFDMRTPYGNYMTGPTHNFTSKASVAAWVKIPTANQQANIHCWFSTGGPNLSTDGFKLDINNWMSADRALTIEAGNGTAGGAWGSGPQFVLDQWQLLTYSLDANAKWIQISRNDTIVYTTTANATRDGIPMPNMNKAFRIGDMQGSYPFNGYINDIGVYRGVFTQAQITDLFNNTRSKYGV